jgi:hypothetical protein
MRLLTCGNRSRRSLRSRRATLLPEVATMDLVASGWQDNVVRRQEFEKRHPDIKIWCENRGLNWYASRDGEEMACATDLGRLIDRLEVLTGER